MFQCSGFLDEIGKRLQNWFNLHGRGIIPEDSLTTGVYLRDGDGLVFIRYVFKMFTGLFEFSFTKCHKAMLSKGRCKAGCLF